MNIFKELELFSKSHSFEYIVSPYISLKPCKHFIDQGCRPKVITTFDFQAFLDQGSDINAICWLLQHGIDVFSVSKLHAKIYYCAECSLAGSANFTNRGIGMPGCEPNKEFLAKISSSDYQLSSFIDDLLVHSDVVTVDLALDMRDQITSARSSLDYSSPYEWNRLMEHNWFPSSHYIRDYYYVSQSDFSSCVGRDLTSVVSDLSYLSLPPSYGSEAAFKKNMIRSLAEEPVFSVFLADGFLPSVESPDVLDLFVSDNFKGMPKNQKYLIVEWLFYLLS